MLEKIIYYTLLTIMCIVGLFIFVGSLTQLTPTARKERKERAERERQAEIERKVQDYKLEVERHNNLMRYDPEYRKSYLAEERRRLKEFEKEFDDDDDYDSDDYNEDKEDDNDDDILENIFGTKL